MKNKYKKVIPKLAGVQLNSLYLINKKRAVQKTFSLFCSPKKGQVEQDQKFFLELSKVEKILVENLNIQVYRWKGNQKTVLLVHGWESNTYRWHALVEKLKKENYNIIAFDGPAHGNSDGNYIHVPLYSQCIEKIVEKYQPDYIVGHSIGAMTAVFHQYKYPSKKIEKLVLLGALSELPGVMQNFKKVLGLKPQLLNDLEQYFKETLGFTFKEFSIAKFAKEVQQEGLIIHDKHDKIVPFLEAEYIHKNWKNSILLATEGAGHSLNNTKIHKEILHYLDS